MSSTLPGQDDDGETAALLVARALSGAGRERQALRDWIGGSAERSALAARLEQAWSSIGALRGHDQMMAWREAACASLAPDPKPRRPFSAWGDRQVGRGLALAASVCAVGACLAVAILFGSPPSAQPLRLEAPRAAIRAVKLADGSTVKLDRGAVVVVRMERGARRVTLLQGQARFDVAHLPQAARRPFLVRAGNVEVRATGTSFYVQQDQGRVMASLTEGGVVVGVVTPRRDWFGLTSQTNVAPVAALRPGQQFVATAGRRPIVRAFDPAEAGAWEEGRVVFKGETLARVAQAVSRGRQVDLVVSGESLRSRRVSGIFAVGNIDGFVDALHTLYPDVRVRRSGSRIEVSAAG